MSEVFVLTCGINIAQRLDESRRGHIIQPKSPLFARLRILDQETLNL